MRFAINNSIVIYNSIERRGIDMKLKYRKPILKNFRTKTLACGNGTSANKGIYECDTGNEHGHICDSGHKAVWGGSGGYPCIQGTTAVGAQWACKAGTDAVGTSTACVGGDGSKDGVTRGRTCINGTGIT